MCKNENGNTTLFGVEAENGIALLTVDEMREQMAQGTRFFVRTKGTDQEVKALHDPDTGEFQYLNIFPDGKPIKQLGDLAVCEECG